MPGEGAALSSPLPLNRVTPSPRPAALRLLRGKGGPEMPHYLVQVAYTAEAWPAMVKKPQNRLDAVRPVIQKLGGKLESGWLAFSDYDIVAICEMPNNVSAAAFAMAASAGGAVKAFKTTP